MVKMRFSEIFGDCYSTRSLRLLKQLGCTDVIGHGPVDGGEVWEYKDLIELKSRVEGFGLRLDVFEDGPKIDKIMLGLPGRDEQLENFCKSLENLGRAGIGTIKPQHMPPGWEEVMTVSNSPTRGGAESRVFDYKLVENLPPTEFGIVSEEQAWDNLSYFLEGVLPTAEDAGVRVSLHPDDPPISPIRGFARILRSVKAFDRMLEIYPSENIGLLFCQGCFAEMGVDVPATIRHFGRRKKIFFAHFRDVFGSVPKFQESFHGEGPTDMFEATKAYYDVGFEGPIRPDHAPKMEGDELFTDGKPGYYLLGKIFALGYMRGLAESIEKTHTNIA
ncbi:MAG: mannonate dehydratase [Candidatus Bathyarchaeia archaeon]|jgi:mannonate dehydratase